MTEVKDKYIEKIGNKEIYIAIVGLGYTGLPLAVEFARAGFKVAGIDINKKKVEAVNSGDSYISDISSEELKAEVENGRITAFSEFSALEKAHAAIICVPTPLNKTKDPDISFILQVTEEIKKRLHPGQLIVLESTTYPGTTRELVLPALEETGLKVGKDFFLCFSPERIDPGNEKYLVKNTPKIIGGITRDCTDIGKMLFSRAIEKMVAVSSTDAAEMTKLLENTFRTINIALVNELAIMCNVLGVNVWEVINAASTKPFGFMRFTPGPGIGGHCLPIDPQYLSWKLRFLNYRARFIELAGEINSEMPDFVVAKAANALNDRKKPLNGSNILILGVAYKPDISDVRESPALDIIHLFQNKKAKVYYTDPHVPEISMDNINMKSESCSRELLNRMDCTVVVTNHSSFDYGLIAKESALIIDSRNVYGNSPADNIIHL